MKLERLLARHGAMGRRRARLAVLASRVRVDGGPVDDPHAELSRFCRVEIDGECVQQGGRRIAIMLYKPCGVLSATRDERWRTVLDLIDDPDRDSLHLAGRLDRASSGLVLLTNDGSWSKRLTASASSVPKVYRVETELPVSEAAVAAFAHGFYFHTEDVTTLPAGLEILNAREVRVTLHEGRYHQIKRMFHRLDNRVRSLHRESIGNLTLPSAWQPGQWRYLDAAEIEGVLTPAPAALDCPAPPDQRGP